MVAAMLVVLAATAAAAAAAPANEDARDVIRRLPEGVRAVASAEREDRTALLDLLDKRKKTRSRSNSSARSEKWKVHPADRFYDDRRRRRESWYY